MGSAEDQFSIGYHMSMMKEELKKKHPNVDVLKDRFARSFMSRRKSILSGAPTKQIVDDYPCLLIPEWVNFYSFRQCMCYLAIYALQILEEMNSITNINLLTVLGNLDPDKMKKIKVLAHENWPKITPHTKQMIG